MAAPASINLFHDALENSVLKLGRAGIKLKEGQYEALKSVVVEGKDTVCVLPTGYGKSLIYQLLPYLFDVYNNNSEEKKQSAIIVLSPLNALMEDQISKLKGTVKVVKVIENSAAVEDLKLPPQILFAHPEVLLENKQIFCNILRSKIYKERVKAIVLDEAHLVVEW